MTDATIKRIFSDLFSSGWSADDLYVIWHAGEPLVLPISYYETAFRLIESLRPPHVGIRHAFQTNGMLINDNWCAFFKEFKVNVGISIDGPEALNDANRLNRSGKSTFADTLSGIRCLQRNGLEFSVITVLTAASLSCAKELHDFYLGENIKNVCFNIEEIEGVNSESSLQGSEIAFERFMRELWDLNTRSSALYYVREFKDMLQKIVRPEDDVDIINTLTEPFEHLSVDCHGNYSTFSPEFLGQTSERYGNFVIGNFWNNTLDQCLESEIYKRLSQDVASGTELCRKSCEYFSVCGGGSPVNKFYENGTIVSSETMYCRLNIKIIANLALEIIEKSAMESGNPEETEPSAGAV